MPFVVGRIFLGGFNETGMPMRARTTPKRKAPAASATGFPAGTTRRGLDGRAWVVRQIANGTRRWTPKPKPTVGARKKAVAPKVKANADAKRTEARAKKAGRPGADRKAPAASATKFAVGTTARGLDGRMWVVRQISNGTKRWTPKSNAAAAKKAAAVAKPRRRDDVVVFPNGWRKEGAATFKLSPSLIPGTLKQMHPDKKIAADAKEAVARVLKELAAFLLKYGLASGLSRFYGPSSTLNRHTVSEMSRPSVVTTAQKVGAAVEYLCAELLEQSGNAAEYRRSGLIGRKDLITAMESDSELQRLTIYS